MYTTADWTGISQVNENFWHAAVDGNDRSSTFMKPMKIELHVMTCVLMIFEKFYLNSKNAYTKRFILGRLIGIYVCGTRIPTS